MKILRLFLALCLVLGVVFVFASCNKDTEPTSTTDSSNNTNDTSDSSTNTTDSSDSTDSSNNNDNTTDTPKIVDYTVRALDPFGNPLEVSVIVELFKDGESLGEMPIRKGSAVFKQEAGEYTFEVKPMEGEFYYDKKACAFTEDVTDITVTLYNYADNSKKQTLWIYDENVLDHIAYDAVQVEEGGAYVTIDRPEMTYFVFTPTRGGIYKVSYEASKAVTIGYFGSPHNVLTSCPIDVIDGAFELEIKNEGVNIGNPGGTTQVVIGIRSYIVNGCVLKIERVGDATVDMPWIDVMPNKNAIKVDNHVNSEFVDFDITDKNLTVVYNEDDGYYHLNEKNGPIIYIRINNAVIKSQTSDETIYMFLPSFVDMCGTDRLGKVFYDDNGKIIRKESYNDLFYAYAELCGTKGLYPLNQQLAEVIKNTGDHKGWFNLDTDYHIFGDMASSVVKENVWLFACVYETQKALGTSEKPAPVSVSTQDNVKTEALLISSGEDVVLRTITNATLTITSAEGITIVANDGTEYTPDDDGKISVVITANQNFTLSYTGAEDTVIHFTFVEYFG